MRRAGQFIASQLQGDTGAVENAGALNLQNRGAVGAPGIFRRHRAVEFQVPPLIVQDNVGIACHEAGN